MSIVVSLSMKMVKSPANVGSEAVFAALGVATFGTTAAGAGFSLSLVTLAAGLAAAFTGTTLSAGFAAATGALATGLGFGAGLGLAGALERTEIGRAHV